MIKKVTLFKSIHIKQKVVRIFQSVGDCFYSRSFDELYKTYDIILYAMGEN